jgi:hypothetical protein
MKRVHSTPVPVRGNVIRKRLLDGLWGRGIKGIVKSPNDGLFSLKVVVPLVGHCRPSLMLGSVK